MKIEQAFIDINPYSRPGLKRDKTTAMVVHWVANPGSSAMFNRNFFDSLKNNLESPWGGSWFASTPYIVGIEGEVVQTMPDEEMHWHAGSHVYTRLAELYFDDLTGVGPNKTSIGIELCHPDLTGEFRKETLDSAIKLFSEVMHKYRIHPTMLFTHHDLVGWKDCPRWFCDHPEAFAEFKHDVRDKLEILNLRRKSRENKAKETNRMRPTVRDVYRPRNDTDDSGM